MQYETDCNVILYKNLSGHFVIRSCMQGQCLFLGKKKKSDRFLGIKQTNIGQNIGG